MAFITILMTITVMVTATLLTEYGSERLVIGTTIIIDRLVPYPMVKHWPWHRVKARGHSTGKVPDMSRPFDPDKPTLCWFNEKSTKRLDNTGTGSYDGFVPKWGTRSFRRDKAPGSVTNQNPSGDVGPQHGEEDVA